jgi:adenylate cyclase
MDADLRPRDPSIPSQPASVIRAFLIADIRGYTRFSDERGDEAAARLAERFVSIAQERIELHSGAIVEVRGDEILAVFDSARHAVRAAVDLQESLAGEQSAEMPLGVGIGIDAGEAVPLGGGYRGRVLNLAARLCARARPGEILVTPELAPSVRDRRGGPIRRPGPGPAQGDLETDQPDDRREPARSR